MSVEDRQRLVPQGRTLVARDFSPGWWWRDLCRILRSSEEVDLGTLSALIQCPLAPFLDECLLSEEEEPDHGLHTIRLTWTCEYELPDRTDEGDVPPRNGGTLSCEN